MVRCGLVALAALCGCRAQAFSCAQDEQCVQAGAAGTCEGDGYCSFPDGACASGKRYGPSAGSNLAGECVGSSATGSGTTTTMDSGLPGSSAGDTVGMGTTGSLDPDLVAWYTMDEVGAGLVLDRSGNNLHGQCDTDECPTLVLGRLGGALRFDGMDDFLTVMHHPRLETAQALTVAVWVNRQDASDSARVVGKNLAFGFSDSWSLSFPAPGAGAGTPAGTARLSILGELGPGSVNAMQVVEPSLWSHIVLTYDGQIGQLYLDGVMAGSLDAPGIMLDSSPITIAGDLDGSRVEQLFTGDLDDLRIYDRVLTSAEIAELAAG